MKILLLFVMSFFAMTTTLYAYTTDIGVIVDNSQGQTQKQIQDQSQILANSGNSAVSFENSFNSSSPIRYLPLATDITYTGMAPQMFSRPSQDKGENFISAQNIISLMGAWSVSELSDEDLDLSDIEIDITNVGMMADRSDVYVESVNFSIQGSDVAKSLKSSKVIAIGTVKCESEDINSVELFMALALKARDCGASNVILIGEGVKIKLESFGWGIGFSYNYAGVTSDAYGTGQVGAGGTGVSGGSASYHKLPYLMFAFKK
jgi:hypothetical protein